MTAPHSSVRIVTDSSCDLPVEVADELGIEIVPLSIRYGDEEFIEAYGMADEHKEWRHKDGRQAAAARGPRGELPSVGDEIQAEVNDDDGRTRWRDAEVRRLLEGGRFECCIDGDEDFNEEYGMADEGTEWRLKPPADLERIERYGKIQYLAGR